MQSSHSVIASTGNIAIGKLSVFMLKIKILVIRNFSIGINNSLEEKAREGNQISKKLNKNGKTKSSTKSSKAFAVGSSCEINVYCAYSYTHTLLNTLADTLRFVLPYSRRSLKAEIYENTEETELF